MREELGIDAEPEYWFESRIRNDIESENVAVFRLVHDGPFRFAPEEIEEIRFWPVAVLREPASRGEFTPNLCLELDRILN